MKNPVDICLKHSALVIWILRGACLERSRRAQNDSLWGGKHHTIHTLSFRASAQRESRNLRLCSKDRRLPPVSF